MQSRYDRIGTGYTETRRPDPRLAARILESLGEAGSVVNVGAGTGSYEPADRPVVAVEPSWTMIRQRPPGAAPAVCARAEALPLLDRSVDAALAILTVHHWTDPPRGLAEMRRVARRRVVVFTWDPRVWESFWLFRDYLPGLREFDRGREVPVDRITAALGTCRVQTVPIPHDCADGFHGAFWRRPAAYLDPRVRAGISSYSLAPAEETRDGLRRLEEDIRTGAWAARHRDLVDRDELDLGYRLIVAEIDPAGRDAG